MKRRGFTLVELLVVLALIAVLALLLAFVLPGFREKSRAAKGAVALQGWLNYARQRALYEQAPRGLRFRIEQNAATKGYVVRECIYLERPDDFRDGTITYAFNSAGPNPATEAAVAGADLAKVEAGDYLELHAAGQVRTIKSVDVAQSKLFFHQPPPNQFSLGANTTTKDFRIIRAARVSGEEPVRLPEGVVIDLAMNGKYQAQAAPLNAFLPQVVDDGAGVPQYFDVLFSPSGAVLDTSGAMVILWVRTDDGADEFDGNPTLVVTYCNSGAVAAYDPVKGTPFAKVK